MMRVVCHLLTLACSFSTGAQDTFKLAPPMLKYASIFFDRSVNIQLAFAQPGTAIHYTLNNREPALSDKVYRHPLLIKEGFTTLKARVFGKGFLPSETISTTFIQSGLPIAQLTASTPNARFPGKGHLSLYDNEGGIADLHNINWTGYQGDSVVIDIELEKQSKITGVLGNFLQDHGSWIYLPEQIRLYYYSEAAKAFKELAAVTIPSDKVNSGSSCVYQLLRPPTAIKTKKLRLIIQPLKKLPAIHPGAGQPAWLFIDEIKVY